MRDVSFEYPHNIQFGWEMSHLKFNNSYLKNSIESLLACDQHC